MPVPKNGCRGFATEEFVSRFCRVRDNMLNANMEAKLILATEPCIGNLYGGGYRPRELQTNRCTRIIGDMKV